MPKKSGPSDRKSSQIFLIKADETLGIVEAIVSVFGIVDYGQDIIVPGSFVKTITERFGTIKVLDQHQTDSVTRVVGKPLELREVGRDQLPPALLQKFPTATGGLWVRVQFNLNTSNGKDVFELLKNGDVNEWSIGYDALDYDFGEIQVGGKTVRVRYLRTIKLWEFSVVIWGMNPATATLGAKSLISKADLPLASRDCAWDAGQALTRVREWVGDDVSKMSQAYLVSGDGIESRFIIADIVDDELKIIPNALISAVDAIKMGDRDLDIPGVKLVINAWYAQMAKDLGDATLKAPFDEKELTVDGPISRLGDELHGLMIMQFMDRVAGYYTCGWITPDEQATLTAIGLGKLSEFRTSIPVDLALRPVDYVYYWNMGKLSLTPDAQVKAGRVLSAANTERIKAALENLEAVLEAAGVLDDTDDVEPEMDDDADKSQPAGPGTVENSQPPTDDEINQRKERLLRRAKAFDLRVKLEGG